MEHGAAAIRANLERVQERIARAAQRAGRDPADVLLVAVTKGQSPEVVRLAYEAGLRDFGENRVEEALPKIAALTDLEDVRWHMIGHIQSRKARAVPQPFALVHSVDREKIARLLDRFAAEAGRRLPVLLECNVSGEASKEGWRLNDAASWESALETLAGVVSLAHLHVRGLMTMAPWTADMEQVRGTFRRLRVEGAAGLPGRAPARGVGDAVHGDDGRFRGGDRGGGDLPPHRESDLR